METTDTTYNGWTNYETWALKLWMDNEEPSYRYVRDEVVPNARAAVHDHSAFEAGHWTFGQAHKFILADMLKDEYEEGMPELEGVWADLLNAALSEVNWEEIAENLLSEIEEGAS